MRVLVLHWGRNGGGPRFAADTVRALRSIDVWTAYSFSEQSERADADRGVADLDLPVVTFETAAQSVAYAPRAVAGARRLRRAIERNRIDCVFATMEQVWQPAVALAVRGTTTPYLLGMHDASFHPGDESRLRSTTRRLEVGAADGLLTFSSAVQHALEEQSTFPAERIWSTFLPASAGPRREHAATERPIRFGFFGRWQAYKGLPLLLDAVRRLDGLQHRPFVVEIHGDGDEPALDGPLPPQVLLWRGWTPEHEVESAIGRFDVLVAPYIEASQSGVVPLAAALGIPSVVTPVGGLVEQVRDGVTGVVAGSTDGAALAEAMGRFLLDESLAPRLGAGARSVSDSEQSPRRFAADVVSTMESLVEAGKRKERR